MGTGGWRGLVSRLGLRGFVAGVGDGEKEGFGTDGLAVAEGGPTGAGGGGGERLGFGVGGLGFGNGGRRNGNGHSRGFAAHGVAGLCYTGNGDGGR